jgi:hypothetical protein
MLGRAVYNQSLNYIASLGVYNLVFLVVAYDIHGRNNIYVILIRGHRFIQRISAYTLGNKLHS